MNIKKIVQKFARTVLWVGGGLFILAILISLLIQLNPVQHFLVQKAAGYLESKIGTPVKVKAVKLIIPNSVAVEGIYLEDQQGDTLLALDLISVDIAFLKLIRRKLVINNIRIKGLSANMYRHSKDGQFNFDYILDAFAKVESATTDTMPSEPIYLSVNKVLLQQIKLKYTDEMKGLTAYTQIGQFKLTFNKTDLKKQIIDIDEIELNSSLANIELFQITEDKAINESAFTNENSGISKTASMPDWKINIGKVNFCNIELLYNDFNSPQQTKGIDFSHLWLSSMNLSAKDLSYDKQAMSGQLNKLSLNSADGFVLKQLQTKFEYTPSHVKFQDFSIETPHSQMQNQIEAHFPSIGAIITNPEQLTLSIELNKNQVGFADLLAFIPELSDIDPFRQHPDASIRFSGTISGPVSQINLQEISISTLNNTRFQFSGNISGLPDINKSKANIEIRNVSTTKNDLNKIITNNLLPDMIQLPVNMSMNGTIIGSMRQVITQLNLQTTLGNATLNAEVFDFDKTDKATYVIKLNLDHINLGHLFSMEPSIGILSGNTQITGQGFDPNTLQAEITTSIKNLDLFGYPYQNLVLIGKMDKKQVLATLNINDPNINLAMDAKADLSSIFPATNIKLTIETLNLQALNIYDADIIFSGLLTANFPSTNPDSLIGTAEASDFSMVSNGKTIPLGQIKLVANADQNGQQINLNSEIVKASLNGNYQLTKLSGALLSAVNKHLNTIEIHDTILSTPQQFDFTAQINKHPIINEFVPQLSHFEPVHLSGKFDNRNNFATLQAKTQNLIFNNINLKEIHFTLQNDSDSLGYQFMLEQINYENYEINHVSAKGAARNKQANIWFNIKDMNLTDKYYFGATATFTDSSTFVYLNPAYLLLHYQLWNVQTDNQIEINSSGFKIKSLLLWSQNQELRIKHVGTSPGAPLQIDLKNFRISTLTGIVETDTLIADGMITGHVKFQQLDNLPVFEGDVYIADFSVYDDTIGNIQLKANNIENNRYTAQVLISGKGNEVTLAGYYLEKPENGNQFSFDADVHQIYLASAEPFARGYLRNLSGSMSGKMKVRGAFDKPIIRGNLIFSQASFNVGMLNATFSIDNDSIGFTPDGIKFDNFTLSDEEHNILIVNGKILTTNYLNYHFGLDINSPNFRVLNSTRAHNNLFYGQVYLNTALRIKGDFDNPQVEGLIRINPQTNFTFIVPQTSPDLIEREGVVAFVDMSNPDTTGKFATYDSLNISRIKGLDVALSIEIDTTAKFIVVVDENSDDRLEIQGDARLTAGIDPGGNVNLTGSYEVSRGTYGLSFNMIHREFNIRRGSKITWKGQPMDAIIDITAIYATNASAYNLVENKLSEPPASLNRYKQRLPFEVLLHMQGELLKPLLNFDIRLNKGNYNVASDVVNAIQNQLLQLRHNDSELNKQVFSLLLLNSFVADNPFSTSSGINFKSTARSSASRLLTDQLNHLAGSLIQGVDFNFDLVSNEDYTTSDQQYRTDLNVDLSKNMFNDRLTVSVGSNFELEGSRNSNREAANLAGNVALDYRLSPDGRFLLRTYRKNEYQGVAEGYIIETGIGFIFTFDYSRIGAFAKKKDEKTP